MDFFGMPNWFWTLVCFAVGGWFALRIPPHITSFRDRYGFSLMMGVLGLACLMAPLSPELIPAVALLVLLVSSLLMRGKS